MSTAQSIESHARGVDAGARDAEQQHGYRMPIVWIAAAVALATLGGCVLMVVLSLGATDRESSAGGEHLLGVPMLQMQEQDPQPRAVDGRAGAAPQ